MSGGNVGDPVEPCPAAKTQTGTVEFEVVGDDGKPRSGMMFWIEMSDDSLIEGIVGKGGKVKLEKVPKGPCKITFPDLDSQSWEVS